MGAQRSIMVIGQIYADSVAQHIAETLEAMGHSVVRFDPSIPRRPETGRLWKRIERLRFVARDILQNVGAVRERFARRLVAEAGRQRVDLTIACHSFLLPDEVRRVKDATGSPVALWFPDAVSNFGRSWFLNADYDALFFKDPYIVDVLRRNLGLRVFYLPECFNPSRLTIDGISEEDRRIFGCDVATAGNLHAYRAAFFARLEGLEVRLWGNPPPGWMDVSRIESMIQNRYVVNQDKARAFRAASAVVNNLHPAEIWGLNARAFEICGARGFQLVDWRPGLAQLFEDGRELVSFRTMDELREKLDRYLADPEGRAEIAQRGHDRALREHTFEHRLSLLIETVLGSADGFPVPAIRVEAEGVRG